MVSIKNYTIRNFKISSYKKIIIVKNINGDFMTKKYIYILFSFFFMFGICFIDINKEEVESVFNDSNDIEKFDNYTLTFDHCELNTGNFIEKFSYFNNKDFKIIELKPYINNMYNNAFIDKKFLYYSSNLNLILEEFKNDYLDVLIDNSLYTINVCIDKVKINTSNIYINEFNKIIPFSY